MAHGGRTKAFLLILVITATRCYCGVGRMSLKFVDNVPALEYYRDRRTWWGVFPMITPSRVALKRGDYSYPCMADLGGQGENGSEWSVPWRSEGSPSSFLCVLDMLCGTTNISR